MIEDTPESDIAIRYEYTVESTPKERIEISNRVTIETVCTFQALKRFYDLSFLIYENNPYWVAPFWVEFRDFFRSSNPFWTHAECKLFTVKEENKIVGRIAGIIDYSFCKMNQENVGYFGFFECIDNNICAEALFQSVHNWFASKHMTKMRGPIDGRIDIGCGFLLNGFDSKPSFFSSYSQPYYVGFAEQYQMHKERDLFIYSIDLTQPIPQRLSEKAQKCEESGITIRPFKRLYTKREQQWWINLFLDTFVDHWGYVPVKPKEVKTRFGIKQMRWFIDSKLFLIAEHNNIPVAYIWSTPDYNQIFQKMNGKLGLLQLLRFFFTKHTITSGKLPLIGIKKEYRNHNIGSYLNYLTLVEMKNRGYSHAEVGWIDEKNAIAHATIARTGAKIHKKYRVFEKVISNA